jgi:hypothetical protein
VSSETGIGRTRPIPHGVVRADLAPPPSGPASLADILERVLDKGIVIAGDIQVNLLDIELLTIKIRLLIASVDRAKEMGIDWWESDPSLTSQAKELAQANDQLQARLERLERAVAGGLATDERRETVVQRKREAIADGKRRTVTERKRRTVTERKAQE